MLRQAEAKEPGRHHILLFPQGWLSLETSKEWRIKRVIHNAGRALPFCNPPSQMVGSDSDPNKELASDVPNLDTLEIEVSDPLTACTCNIFSKVSFDWISGLTLTKKSDVGKRRMFWLHPTQMVLISPPCLKCKKIFKKFQPKK